MLSTATWQLWYNIRLLEPLMDDNLIEQLSRELWDRLYTVQRYQQFSHTGEYTSPIESRLSDDMIPASQRWYRK